MDTQVEVILDGCPSPMLGSVSAAMFMSEAGAVLNALYLLVVPSSIVNVLEAA